MTKPLSLSLSQVRANNPCADGWRNAIRFVGDRSVDTQIPLSNWMDEFGYFDVLWNMRAFPEIAPQMLMYAVWCFEDTLPSNRHFCKIDMDSIALTKRRARGLVSVAEMARFKESIIAAQTRDLPIGAVLNHTFGVTLLGNDPFDVACESAVMAASHSPSYTASEIEENRKRQGDMLLAICDGYRFQL